MTHVDVLGQWTVAEGVLQVVGVDAGAVWDDQGVSGRCHGNHTPRLSDAAQPCDVRLDHIHTARLQQLAESVPGVCVGVGGVGKNMVKPNCNNFC